MYFSFFDIRKKILFLDFCSYFSFLDEFQKRRHRMLQLLLVMQVKLSSGLWQKLKVEVLLLSMILVAQLPVKIQLPGEGFLPPFAGPRETRLASDFFQQCKTQSSQQ